MAVTVKVLGYFPRPVTDYADPANGAPEYVNATLRGGKWECVNPDALELLELNTRIGGHCPLSYLPDADLGMAQEFDRRWPGTIRIVGSDLPPAAPGTPPTPPGVVF